MSHGKSHGSSVTPLQLSQPRVSGGEVLGFFTGICFSSTVFIKNGAGEVLPLLVVAFGRACCDNFTASFRRSRAPDPSTLFRACPFSLASRLYTCIPHEQEVRRLGSPPGDPCSCSRRDRRQHARFEVRPPFRVRRRQPHRRQSQRRLSSQKRPGRA